MTLHPELPQLFHHIISMWPGFSVSQLHDHGTNAPRGEFFYSKKQVLLWTAVNLVTGLEKGPIKIRVEKWISCKIQALNLCETSPCWIEASRSCNALACNGQLQAGLRKLFLLCIPTFRNVEWNVFISWIGLHSLVSFMPGWLKPFILTMFLSSSSCVFSQFPCLEVVACHQIFTTKKHGQSLGDKINSFGCKVTPNSLQLWRVWGGNCFSTNSWVSDTGAGRNPKPPGMYKTLEIMG